MLPLFRIVGGGEMQQEGRRERRVEVPVHRSFGANFGRRRGEEEEVRVSRRGLVKEVERLQQEQQELLKGQEYLSRKNCKLKENLAKALQANEELGQENQQVKRVYEELLQEVEKPKICQNCEISSQKYENLAKNCEILKQNLQESCEDSEMLKNVVYRLNVQLERYQEKTKSVPQDFPHSRHSPVAWGNVNTHTLAPLLAAYQETIEEKQTIIQSYESELADFTAKLKLILKENENLHLKLTEDSECSKVINETLSAVKDELRSTKEQNDLLIKKCALKQDKIEEILKCYEAKVEQLKRDYGVLHEQYCKSRSEIVGLKEKNKSLAESQDEFKSERQQYIPVSVHNSSVNECKKWYEELKSQYENEKAKMAETIDGLRENLQSLERKIADLKTEKAEVETKLKNAEKHIKKAEVKFLDLEHSLNEVQLSRSACRKQLHKAMSFAKDLVAEQESLLKALNQRQQENKAVKRIGTDIASRMDLLRNELKCVQKEAWQELSTVEERLQEQDSVISRMKQEHQQELERLKQVIRQQEEALNSRKPASLLF